LTEDTTFDESIKVEGHIKGWYGLKVAGNIIAWNIDAGNIDAENIVFCESVKLKDKVKGKIKARMVVRKRFELEQKEFESD
jgi:hypothetical protein